jgi:hypothetical protein
MTILRTLQDRLSIRQEYRAVFNTPQGQKVLADILRRAGVTRPQFEADPEKARIMEGHRHLAHSIYRMVHSSDEPLLKQIAEETQRSTQHESNY